MSEFNIDEITKRAQEYVASLSDAEVLRRLTDKQSKEAAKKRKAQEAKELKKAIEKAIAERGEAISKEV